MPRAGLAARLSACESAGNHGDPAAAFLLVIRLLPGWHSVGPGPAECMGNREMSTGTIKKLILDKGIGFIEGQGGDVFFHHSALVGLTIEQLREGMQVEYDEGTGPKGPRAENVRAT